MNTEFGRVAGWPVTTERASATPRYRGGRAPYPTNRNFVSKTRPGDPIADARAIEEEAA